MDSQQINPEVLVNQMTMVFITIAELIANTDDGRKVVDRDDKIIWAGRKALDNMWRAYSENVW